MTAEILDGKFYSEKIKNSLMKSIDTLKTTYNVTPKLVVVIVGEDEASKIYVANKHKTCLNLNIDSDIVQLDANISKEELISEIEKLNNDPNVNGILIQLPLPQNLRKDEIEILSAIDPIKDVDGFSAINIGKLELGVENLVPCTPYGCVKMLEYAGIEIEGKHAVVIGRSNIVGRPMYNLLLARNATVTICHSKTKNLAEFTKQADILVVAIGKPNFVTKDMVKKGAVVIDVGINRVPGTRKINGDVDFESVKEVASHITPVPGGVGLITIAMLIHNTLKAICLQKNIDIPLLQDY
ncbi:bifunctional 5,10-methylenetetrahydrofolate dehydrogenase/5,10-methenyltetrahydrofolate cyclohydrolase [Selenomonadales bacterium OttesenSCG-928-I06]|nr:bifunctional 5,10-methylenetetrahydrofolate dehydrogenase/5,10-methenyltetrahydrofolate cyclohydrolase [Selenomonadales bacterium OttesenSCG-928-I06]